jgi:hypothetical protein
MRALARLRSILRFTESVTTVGTAAVVVVARRLGSAGDVLDEFDDMPGKLTRRLVLWME